MKDRDTEYRLSQNAILSCVFDEFIPGTDDTPCSDSSFMELTERCISNGTTAGKFLEREDPEYFLNSETAFFLSSAQKGKVRGDIFEILVRAVLWNQCAVISRDPTHEKQYAAVSLGDNYDLKKLFVEEDANTLKEFESHLAKKDTSFAYSTPDVIIFEYTDEDMADYFSVLLNNLGPDSQKKIWEAKSIIEGKLKPENIVLAAGIKTSIRSDRMYQLLFEANAWKALWRTVYGLTPSKYFSLIGGHYGADPAKLSSVDFSSLIQSNPKPARAIDGLISITTPNALTDWLTQEIG